MAEGPRPLVSFSLQQLHLLLSTAQHQRAKWPGAGARGQDVTSDSKPTSQTSTALQDAPSQLWEQRRGVWRWPGSPHVPGWTPSLARPFKGALQDHVQALAQRRTFQNQHTLSCFHCARRDVTWHKRPPAQNTGILQNRDTDKSQCSVGLWPYTAKF